MAVAEGLSNLLMVKQTSLIGTSIVDYEICQLNIENMVLDKTNAYNWERKIKFKTEVVNAMLHSQKIIARDFDRNYGGG